jgi:anti-sigma regulatory factor (Ser/Thr protein kinase)
MESITLPGTLESLAPIREFVDRAVALAGIETKAGYRLRLAVDEIATNIVNYGYQPTDMTGDIRLEATVDDHCLTIVVEDTAPPFDPIAVDEPDDLGLDLGDRKIGGLGIFLTVRGVDEFHYQRVQDGNRNVFVVNRPDSVAAQTSA